MLDALDLRLVRLATDQVRGHDPIRDLAWLLRRRPHPVILDVGANDGETVSAFLRRFPRARILAFEPYAPLYQRLARCGNMRLIVKTVTIHTILYITETSIPQNLTCMNERWYTLAQ